MSAVYLLGVYLWTDLLELTYLLVTVSEYEPAVNEVEVPVLNRDLCNQWLEHRDLNVTEGMICAGYPEGGKDACQVRIQTLQRTP